MTAPEPRKVTVIDRFIGLYSFLNNFYPDEILYEGIRYKALEYGFAAAKTNDVALKYRISTASSPGEAKRMGREVVLREGWDQYLRYTVMEELLALKFGSGSELGNRLLDTGDAVLIEGNTWHDQTWGDCRCGRCVQPGMNLLGWMLMRRRERLRERRGQGKERQ